MKFTALAFALMTALSLGLIGCSKSDAPSPDAEVFTASNTATTQVEGMTCSACEGAVCSAIKEFDGVKDVTADAKTGEVKIALEEGATLDTAAVKKAIDSVNDGKFTSADINLPAGGDSQQATPAEDDNQSAADADADYFVSTYKIDGMTCTACSGAVDAALAKIDGVESATADHKTGKVELKVAKNSDITKADIAQALAATGTKFKLAQ